MAILVSGSLAYDYIMNFPDSFRNHILPHQLHILSVCFTVDRLERGWGGTGGNIVYTLKLLGDDPLIVSVVGKDGQAYLEYLKKNGIASGNIIEDDQLYTASAHITTDRDNNQVTAFYNGPLERAQEISVYDLKQKFTLAIIAPTAKEVMMRHIKECQELGIPAVFDPGQQITTFNDVELRSVISQSAFVIGNDYEIKLLQERTGWDAAEILKNVPVMITTLGERGSIVTTSDGDEFDIKPCPPESVDDPTGAGDAYRAGFFVGVEKGFDYQTCGQMGSVAASYAVESYGTQHHQFTAKEFCKRYEKTYGQALELKIKSTK
jgi:adenosine kinase